MLKIPEDIVQAWELAGNKLPGILEFVKISESVATALFAAAGLDENTTAADVAYINGDERADMIASMTISDGAPNLVERSRMRQFYAACQVAAIKHDPPGHG